MADALVPWPMCVEAPSPAAENIVVSARSHRALGDDPQVRRIVADRLAQPDGEWQPYGG